MLIYCVQAAPQTHMASPLFEHPLYTALHCTGATTTTDGTDYRYYQLDAWGNVFQANSLGVIPRHQEVVSDLSFVHRLGYGFSVFNLGKLNLDNTDIGTVAENMAARMEPHVPRGCMVQLVQLNQQHLSVKEQMHSVPTTLMVVWGGCYFGQTDDAFGYLNKQIDLMRAQRERLEQDDLALQADWKRQMQEETNAPLPADWLENFREFYPKKQLPAAQLFTYDKLATCQPVQQLYVQAQINRRVLAAKLLKASGIQVPCEDKLFNPDQSQLYFWFDQTTTLVQIVEQTVLFAEQYNLAGSNTACVMHSPCRGLDLYVRDFHQGGELSELDKQSHALKPGAPTCSPNVFTALSKMDKTPSPTDVFNVVETELAKLHIEQQMKDYVAIAAGSVMSNGDLGTKFIPLDACDAAYSVLNPMNYAESYQQYKVMHCSTLLSVMPSPLEANGKLYGVIDPDLKHMLMHVHPHVDHITFPNTEAWVNQLTRISPGKAPFIFMNDKTAIIDEASGDYVAFRVPKALIESKAKF